VQLTRGFAVDTIDHSPASDGRPFGDRIYPARNVLVRLSLKERKRVGHPT
jgi:hypothetical protein